MNVRNKLASAMYALGFTVALSPNITLAAPISEIFSLGGGVFPQDHIYRVDLTTNAVTDLGSGGAGFTTNLAMSPSRVFYYMNPFEVAGGGHDLYTASINMTNTALVTPTLLTHLPTAGFGIIDGFTIGPNGDLYMTGYGKSEIYRFNTTSFAFTTEVHIVGAGNGEFRSDLAFDPVSGNLVGLGIKPGSADRTLFQVLNSQLTNGTDDAYTWDYFGGIASAWSTKNLQSGTEIGGNPDGIAFDPTNGNLYLSGDGTGIYAYDRNTAARGTLLPGTGDGALNGLGYDLAFQTRVDTIPEPGSLALVALGFAACACSLRRNIFVGAPT